MVKTENATSSMITSLVFFRSSSRLEIYRISGPTEAMNCNVFLLPRLTLPPMLLRSRLPDLRHSLLCPDGCGADIEPT